MTTVQPDRDRDVFVQHVTTDADSGERWVVYLGREPRTSLASQQHAMVFARLLADLQQRRVWMCHDLDGEASPVDHSQLRGCSCC